MVGFYLMQIPNLLDRFISLEFSVIPWKFSEKIKRFLAPYSYQ